MHSREKKSISTNQNMDTSFPNQETLTSNPPNPPTVKNPTIKRNYNCQNTESPPQTEQSKQIEKAEKYSADKEHDKCPPNQTKEEEIGSLPEKEFRIMIVKMVQNFENKMELQINSLETRIKKMQEMFNKDIKEIKKESVNNE